MTPAVPISTWNTLSSEERSLLNHLLGGKWLATTANVTDQLMALGLLERLRDGVGITQAGKDLVLRHLGWKASYLARSISADHVRDEAAEPPGNARRPGDQTQAWRSG